MCLIKCLEARHVPHCHCFVRRRPENHQHSLLLEFSLMLNIIFLFHAFLYSLFTREWFLFWCHATEKAHPTYDYITVIAHMNVDFPSADIHIQQRNNHIPYTSLNKTLTQICNMKLKIHFILCVVWTICCHAETNKRKWNTKQQFKIHVHWFLPFPVTLTTKSLSFHFFMYQVCFYLIEG